MVTTIQIDEKVKDTLDKLKIYYRESYNELIKRMIECYSDADKESLVETIEIMVDPEMMRNIAKGIEDYEKGVKGKTLAEIKKEFG